VLVVAHFHVHCFVRSEILVSDGPGHSRGVPADWQQNLHVDTVRALDVGDNLVGVAESAGSLARRDAGDLAEHNHLDSPSRRSEPAALVTECDGSQSDMSRVGGTDQGTFPMDGGVVEAGCEPDAQAPRGLPR